MRAYGGTEDDRGESVLATADGGFIVVGYTRSYVSCQYGCHLWLMKADSEGDHLWSKLYGEGDCPSYKGYDVSETSDGNYIITGSADGDVLLLKVDENGNKICEKIFEINHSIGGNEVSETVDGGFIIVGSTSYGYYWGGEVILLKTNKTGNEEWSKIYEFGGINSDSIGNSVIQTEDGDFVVTGTILSGSASVIFLIKVNPTGDIIWSHQIQNSQYDFGNKVFCTTDAHFAVVGVTRIYDPDSNRNMLLIKTNQDGNDSEFYNYGGRFHDYGLDGGQVTFSDAGYILVGGKRFSSDGDPDVFLVKTDPEGNEKWNRTFGSAGYDSGESIDVTDNEGYIITGYTDSFGAGGEDLLLIYYHPYEDPPVYQTPISFREIIISIGLLLTLFLSFLLFKKLKSVKLSKI